MYRTYCLLVGFIGLATFFPSPLSANDRDPVALHRKGVQAFKEGRFIEAAAAFRAANAAKPSWKLLYNIGQCEAAAKRHGLALSALEAYLSQGGDDIPVQRRDQTLAEVERLRKMVGRVKITAPPGATVFMDGVDRGTAPILGNLPVAASVNHEIWAVVNGQELERQSFKVSGGDTVAIDIAASSPEQTVSPEPELPELGPEPVPAAPVPPPQAPSRSKLSIAGWVSTAAGAALLIGGSVTGGLALKKDKDIAKDCVDGHCLESRSEDIDTLNSLALTTNILFAVGGAAVATGVILLIVDRSRHNEKREAVAVVPAFGPRYGGLALKGRF